MKKNIKKIVSLGLVLVLCMSMSVVSFAKDYSIDNTKSISEAASESSIQPRAVSGTGTVTTSGYGTCTIYSPGWSLFAHANVTVTGGDAVISIVNPNGEACIDGGTVWLSPGANQRVGLMKTTKTGNYEVRVQSAYGDNVTVTVTLCDF